MRNGIKYLAVLGLGAALGYGLTQLIPGSDQQTSTEGEAKPLYWVAPMDANYRRDKPGKSPMGMDLIPVYEEGGGQSSPGTVSISPLVQNNLGVRLGKAELLAGESQIHTLGYVQYDEDQLVHLHPRVEGWIERLHVTTAGDKVTKGQALYEFYSPTLVNAQEELVLALSRSNKALIRAAKERLKALHVSDALIAQISNDRRIRQTITVYSPQTGIVDNLAVRQGFFVKPDSQVMSIGALEQVWVMAEVFERQSAALKVGDKVAMTVDYLPGMAWEGEVDYLYPTLDLQTRTLKVRVRFANPEYKLKPNMFANLRIAVSTDKPSLQVPAEALIVTQDMERVVLSLGEGKFKSVKVTSGQRFGDKVEIVSGLDEGDEIVTSAQFLLDSESAISSDFKRMSDDKSEPAWVAGSIKASMPKMRMVTATHEAIEAWGWPQMTMDFNVADEVDMQDLLPGTELHMELSQQGEEYVITKVHIMSRGAYASAEVTGTINDIEAGRANISRGPIKKWNRPATTMDFVFDHGLDTRVFKAGDKVKFRFEVRGDEFVIVAMEKLS